MSRRSPRAARIASSFRTTSISVRPPSGAVSSSQARNSATAAPSRTCAARAPASSAAFLTALGSTHGSRSQTTVAPDAASRSDTQTGALPRSTATRPPSASSAGPNRSGGATATSGPRCARTAASTLASSANSRTRPSAPRIAKTSGTGVRAMSEPRTLSSQAIESGSVSTAADRSRSTSPRASAARLSADDRPASSAGCGTIGRAGGGGWSGQASSTRLPTRTSPICRGPSASVSASISLAVCSHGSNPSRPPRATPAPASPRPCPPGAASPRSNRYRPRPAPAAGSARRRRSPPGRA